MFNYNKNQFKNWLINQQMNKMKEKVKKDNNCVQVEKKKNLMKMEKKKLKKTKISLTTLNLKI